MKNKWLACLVGLLLSYSAWAQSYTPYVGIGHQNPIKQIDFAEKGRYMITTDESGKCVVWDFFGRRELNARYVPADASISVVNDTLLRVGKSAELLTIPRLLATTEPQQLIEKKPTKYRATFDQDAITFYADDRQERVIPRMANQFRGISINADQTKLVHVCGDNFLIIRSTTDVNRFSQLDLHESLTQVAFHPALSHVAIVGIADGSMNVVDVQRRTVLFRFRSDLLRPSRVYTDRQGRNLILDSRNYSHVFDLTNMTTKPVNVPELSDGPAATYYHVYDDSLQHSDFYTWTNYKLYHETEGVTRAVGRFPFTRIQDRYLRPISAMALLLWAMPIQLFTNPTALKVNFSNNVRTPIFQADRRQRLYYGLNNSALPLQNATQTVKGVGKGNLLFTFDDRHFLTFHDPYYVTVTDQQTRQAEHYFLDDAKNIVGLHTVRNDRFLIQQKESFVAVSYEKELKRVTTHKSQYINTAPDQTEFYAQDNQQLIIYDADTFAEQERIDKQMNRAVSFVMPVNDQKGRTRRFVLYDIGIGQLLDADHNLIATFYFYENGEFLSMLPDNRFFASSKTLLHDVIIKDQVGSIFQLDQFEALYNRPDAVLKQVGLMDSLSIQTYRLAYQKFLKRSGQTQVSTATSLQPPVAELLDFNTGVSTTSATLPLRLRLKSQYALSSFNIYINNTPVFGKQGYQIRQAGQTQLDTVVSITLSRGENIIKPVCIDTNGIKSYATTYYVQADYPAEGNVYLLGIGIDNFADTTHNLSFAVKDIHDLAINLRNRYGNRLVIDTLFNQHVTSEAIARRLKAFQKLQVNDRVFVAYSGHGLLDDSLRYYLSTHTTRFSAPAINSLTYERLENLMDSIPIRQKLVLLDACNSGDVDSENFRKFAQQGSARGVIVKDQKKTAPTNNVFDIMQDMFSGYSQGSGTVIISAARGDQYAQEGKQWANGAFTHSLLLGLTNNTADLNRNGIITISELKLYVSRKVAELTKGTQKPTARKDVLDFDWSLD